MFFSREARAQTRAETETWLENLEIGGWLGPNVTWFAGADASGEGVTSVRRTGFAAAVEARSRLRPWLSAAFGVGFSTKGAKSEFRSGRSGDFRSGYVLVPLLVQLAPYRLGRLEPYLLAGPEIGFMVDCDGDDGVNVTVDCTGTTKLIDPGLVVGGGFAIVLPWPGTVRFEARYEHGLISIDDRDLEQDIKNRAVLFSVGYSHRLGGSDHR